MAAPSLGKKWEVEFKQDWKASLPNSFIYRLPDQMTGYKQTSMNPCDFVCFADKKLFMVECKEHKGISIPFSAMAQADRLIQYMELPDVYPGLLVWFSDPEVQKVIWVGAHTIKKMLDDGQKSIRLKMLEDPNNPYNIKVLEGTVKKKFVKIDYSQYLEAMTDE